MVRSVPWQPGIGDPTLFGWLTVLAYIVAAATCIACAWQAARLFNSDRVWQQRLIWSGLAIGLLFLGVNKQLDLQSWFTAIMKEMAYEQGWYEMGQRGQILFIALLGLASIGVLLVVSWQMRHEWRQSWLLLLGLVFLARFIIVRAASFYGVPLPELSQFTNGLRITWLLEILGAGSIALSALLHLRRRDVP